MRNVNATDAFFHSVYREESNFGKGRPPWDIGGPQPVFAELVSSGQIRGEVLDAGFGPAGLSLYLSGEGFTVTGIDQSPEAVDSATARAAEQGLPATFAVGDLLDLAAYAGRFDTVVECGVFHGLGAVEQRSYAASLHLATRPGALVHLLNLNERGQRTARERCAALGVPPRALVGFRPVRAGDLRAAFANGWKEVSITERPMSLKFPGDGEPTELASWLSTFARRGE